MKKKKKKQQKKKKKKKNRSLKSSEHINEKVNGQHRGFGNSSLFSDPEFGNMEPKRVIVTVHPSTW